jgi:hypothetical protein
VTLDVHMWKMSMCPIYLQEPGGQSWIIGVLEELALGRTHPGLAAEEDNFTSSIISHKDEPASVQVHDDAMRSPEALKSDLHYDVNSSMLKQKLS